MDKSGLDAAHQVELIARLERLESQVATLEGNLEHAHQKGWPTDILEDLIANLRSTRDIYVYLLRVWGVTRDRGTSTSRAKDLE